MVKLKHCWIGTKIGVLVDIDPSIMVVVCDSSFGQICDNILLLKSKNGHSPRNPYKKMFNMKFGMVVV